MSKRTDQIILSVAEKEFVEKIQLRPLLVWILGVVVGALTNIDPSAALVIGIPITVVLLFIVIRQGYLANLPSRLSTFEDALRDPDNFASTTVERSNQHYLVIGQAIEIVQHPNLQMRDSIENLGWEPKQVKLIDTQEKFDASELVTKAGGYREFDPPNGVKYCLSKLSYVTVDSPNLVMECKRSDYFTIQSVLSEIRSMHALRAEYANLEPELHRVPNSLCLHYIVRFADGEILAVKRDRRSAWHGDRWSFSGEEQLDSMDFESADPVDSLFKRAFCEEVIPFAERVPLSDRWAIASSFIRTMRCWTVFLEEGIANYGMCQGV